MLKVHFYIWVIFFFFFFLSRLLCHHCRPHCNCEVKWSMTAVMSHLVSTYPLSIHMKYVRYPLVFNTTKYSSFRMGWLNANKANIAITTSLLPWERNYFCNSLHLLLTPFHKMVKQCKEECFFQNSATYSHCYFCVSCSPKFYAGCLSWHNRDSNMGASTLYVLFLKLTSGKIFSMQARQMSAKK